MYGSPYGVELIDPNEVPGPVTEVAYDQVEKYVGRGAEQIVSLLQTQEMSDALSTLGLKTYIKDLNKQRLINILAAMGLFSVFRGAKNNLGKVGVSALAIWLISQNKAKIDEALAQLKSELSFDSIA